MRRGGTLNPTMAIDGMITVYQTGTPSVVNQSTRGWGTLRGRPEGAPLPLVALLRLLEEVGVEVLFKERVILLAVVSNLLVRRGVGTLMRRVIV